MAVALKTARDMFYFVDDVMRLLGYSRSKSYKVIAQLNRELEAKGSFPSWRSRELLPLGSACCSGGKARSGFTGSTGRKSLSSI